MTRLSAITDAAAAGAAAPRRRASIRVLGPLAVTVGTTDVHPRASRQRRLLAALALSSGRPGGSIEETIDAVYGDDASDRSRHSLATELWRVRQILGADAVVTDTRGYRLDLARVEIDLVEFERLLADGRTALHRREYEAAEAALATALGLWRGDPVEDLVGHPIGRAAAARLTELYLGGTEDHAEALAGLARHTEAVELLEPMLARHRTREHGWALLVECCVHGGQQRRARMAFDSARRALADYGVEIGTELQVVQGLLDQREPTAAPTRATGRPRAPGFVGRDEDCAALVDVLRPRVGGGRPATAVVRGEAGIGKSTLVDQAVARLQGHGASPLVLPVVCDQRADLPYATLLRALSGLTAAGDTRMASVLADLEQSARPADTATAAPREPDSPARRRELVHEAVIEVLGSAAARSGGLVLTVEDAQVSTPETLDIVLELLGRPFDAPLAVIVTVREPAQVDSEVAQRLARLRRRAALDLVLHGLDEAATAQLLGRDAVDDDVRDAHRLSGGNPLFLRQIDVLRGNPRGRRATTLDALVDEHVSSVGAEVAAVLRLCAVAGTGFDVRPLTAAASRPPTNLVPTDVADALEQAVSAGLLRETGSTAQLTFVHAVVRDRLYATTPAADRATAHLAIGQALERLLEANDPPVELIAHHYANAWPACRTEAAVSRLVAAADRAVTQTGFAVAERYYRRALDLIGMDPDHADHATVARVLDSCAQAIVAGANGPERAEMVAELDRARATYGAAIRLAEARDLPAIGLRAALGVVRTYSLQRIDGQALDVLAGWLARTVDGPDPAAAREIVAGSIAALYAHRPASVAGAVERIRERDPAGHVAVLTALWSQQGVTGQLQTAQQLITAAPSDELGAWLRVWVSEVCAGHRALDDPPPAAGPHLADTPSSRWERAAWDVTVAIACGRFARAEHLLSVSGALVSQAGSPAEIATRVAAVRAQSIRLRLIRSDDADPTDQPQMPRSTWLSSHPVALSWSAYYATITGDLETAAALCGQLVEQYEDGVLCESELLPWAGGAAFTASRTGHRHAVRVLRAALQPHSGHHMLYGFTAYWGCVDHHLGNLADADGDSDEAVRRLADAVVQYRHAGARAYESRALGDLARVRWWRDTGTDRARAAAEYRDCVAIAASIGMSSVASAPWPPVR